MVLPRSVSRVDTVSGSNLNARVAALARIFDMASDETEADHPMCLECAAFLRDEIDARAKEADAECEIHRKCLEELERERGGETRTDAEAEAVRLEAEEREVCEETRRLEDELRVLNAERASLEVRLALWTRRRRRTSTSSTSSRLFCGRTWTSGTVW